jgi:hypothetical protein
MVAALRLFCTQKLPCLFILQNKAQIMNRLLFTLLLPFLFCANHLLLGQDTFADNFENQQYDNNDGSQNFTNDWSEDGDGGNPSGGGRIRIRDNQLRFRGIDSRSISRDLDLSIYGSVTLTLDYTRTNGGNNQVLFVQLFNGISYQTVVTLNGSGTVSYTLRLNEIRAYASIRFIGDGSNWNNSDEFFLDNLLFTAELPDFPPVVSGSGNQVYCPGASIPIAQTINITDPDDTGTSAVYIQISGGYVNGEDLLSLVGSHPNITASWEATQGELTLQGPATYSEFETAILSVEYSSSATSPSGTRQFSITVGEANFLPATQHYYEFVSDVGITWTDAQVAASNRTYFGLQGYLATLTTLEEAQFSGSQSQGTGWIGASDAATEGDWRWVTGPEAGTPFWSGRADGNTVAPTNFAFWNGGEPNQSGNEDYAHITDPSVVRGGASVGSWNDLSNTGGGGAYRPQGYVVEYGGMPGDPVLNISATTSITMGNCAVITNRRITFRVKPN